MNEGQGRGIVPRPCSRLLVNLHDPATAWALCCKPSANDKLSHPPHLLAPLKPDGHSPGADIVHHNGAGFINAFRHFANADRTDDGIPMQPCQGGVAGTGDFAPDQAGAVLQSCEAAGIKPPGQLVDGANTREHFHGSLDCAAGDRTHL